MTMNPLIIMGSHKSSTKSTHKQRITELTKATSESGLSRLGPTRRLRFLCPLNERQREPQEVTKEIVGIHVLLTRSLFGDGILRSLLLRVSLAKPTSAPLRC